MKGPSGTKRELLEENSALKRRITELEQSESKRRQVEGTMSALNGFTETVLDNLHDYLLVIDPANYTILGANRAFTDSCGLDKETVIGRYCYDLTHNLPAPCSPPDHICPLEETLKTGKPSTVEHIHHDGTGGKLYIEITTIPVMGREGEIEHIIHLSRNITDRKLAEEKLRVTQFAVDSAAESIGWIGKEGRYLYVNDYYCRLLGYSRDELLSRNCYDLDPNMSAESWPARWEQTKQQGLCVFETLRRSKSGVLIPVEIHANYLSYDDKEFIVTYSRDIRERKRSEEQLNETLANLRKAFNTTIQVMVSAVETRDPYTAGHQIRSADLARTIATEMGLSPEKIEGIRMAGTIHDIGKLSVPAEILSKPTKLSEIEFSLVKEHARVGYEMLKNVESPWPLAEIVRQHHERMDGSGYPQHLKGDDILIEARILAVADVVEAMASHRPYRPGLGIEAALNEIKKNRGIFYDNAVADACLRLFRERGYKLLGI